MPTFEDIQKANSMVSTTSIKGKSYTEVNQRIKAFRMVYPNGFILTSIKSHENGMIVFTASVGFYENGEAFTIGTGTAYEKEGSTQINRTSYIENCETSAVGRALGMAGFGIDTSVASKEEVEQAIAQQEADKGKTMIENAENAKIDQAKIDVLAKKIVDDDIDAERFLMMCNVNGLKELTFKQWKNAIDNWENVKARC